MLKHGTRTNHHQQTLRTTDKLCYTSGVSLAMSATPSAPSSLFSSFRYQTKRFCLMGQNLKMARPGDETKILIAIALPSKKTWVRYQKFRKIKYIQIQSLRLDHCSESKMWIFDCDGSVLVPQVWSKGKNFQTKPCLWVVLWVGQQLDPQMNVGK